MPMFATPMSWYATKLLKDTVLVIPTSNIPITISFTSSVPRRVVETTMTVPLDPQANDPESTTTVVIE